MFRKHRKSNGDWVPEETTRLHHVESPEVQMRIIRTHIAAQASEIGNLSQQLREIKDVMYDLREVAGRVHDEYLGLNR